MGTCSGSAPPSDGRVDLAVVGAGSAGFSAAITAAELGARVALVGHGEIGGTCVNVGCVPSKTLIRAVESLHHASRVTAFAGLEGHATVRDWAALVAQKDDLVAELRRQKYEDVLAAYPAISYVGGAARLTATGVDVAGRVITAPHTIVTTGTRPATPPIRGLDTVPFLTSTSALALSALPHSLAVVGAGYVGVELAQLFARVGVAVTLVARHALLPTAEPEVRDILAAVLRDEGVTVLTDTTVDAVASTSGGIVLRTRDATNAPRLVTAAQLLVATGRIPNTEGLDLDALTIARDAVGHIHVDDYLRTTNRRVFAAGDVTGRDPFVYMAAYGARLAARNALQGDVEIYDRTLVPTVVFTDPQAASVGLTEAEARRHGYAVATSLLPLSHVPRAVTGRATRGVVKLVADAATSRLLGAHMLAPEAGDAIQTAALALRYGMSTSEMGRMVVPYLTTVESLKLAAQGFSKDVARLSCCAG